MTLKQYMAQTGIGYLRLSRLAGVSTNTIRNACKGGQPRVGAALRIHWATDGRVSLEALAGLTPDDAHAVRQKCHSAWAKSDAALRDLVI